MTYPLPSRYDNESLRARIRVINRKDQRNSISIVTAGRDLMACAQTGSGKTAAFLIPTCSALITKARNLIARPAGGYEARRFKAMPLVLIVAPTRELCCQIFDEARRVRVHVFVINHLLIDPSL